MVAKAVLRYIRMSPRKFRLIVPLVKGKDPESAIAILMSVKKNASKYAIDLLKSAIANAKHKRQAVDISNLYISKLTADCGPMLKRFRAASMGRASMIHKHTSHLTLELDEKAPSEQKETKTKAKKQHVKDAVKDHKGREERPEKASHKTHKSKKGKESTSPSNP